MNPEPTPTPREQTEMRLTALLMGELSAEETVALHALLAADPELAKLHARLRQAMELLREATAEPEPATPTPTQLSSERRERLLAHFQNPAPQPAKPALIVKPPRSVWSWVVRLGAAAAAVFILAGLFFPSISAVKESARKSAHTQLEFRVRAADHAEQLRSDDKVVRPEIIAGLSASTGAALPNKPQATALYLPPTTDAPASGEPAGEPQAIPLAGLGRAAAGGFIYFPGDSTSKSADSAPPVNGFDGFVNFGSALAQTTPGPTAPSTPTPQAGKDARDLGQSAALPADGDKQIEIKAKNMEIAQNNLQELNLGHLAGGERAKANLKTAADGTIRDEPSGPRRPADKEEGDKLKSSKAQKAPPPIEVGADVGEGSEGADAAGEGAGEGQSEGQGKADAVPRMSRDLAKRKDRAADPFVNIDARRSEQPALEPADVLPDLAESYAKEGRTEIDGRGAEVNRKGHLGDTLARRNRSAAIQNYVQPPPPPSAPMPVVKAEAAEEKRKEIAVQPREPEMLFKTIDEMKDLDGGKGSAGQGRQAEVERSGFARALAALEEPAAENAEGAAEGKKVTRPATEASKSDPAKAELQWHRLTDRAAGTARATPRPAATPAPARTQLQKPATRSESRYQEEAAAPAEPLAEVEKKLASPVEQLAKLKGRADQPAKPAEGQKLKEVDEELPAARPAQPAAIPQPEVATSANAFSTFSLNVSDVAFKLAGASLEKGRMPELATVRSEEFINAFDYRDPEPAAGAPLAFATERARYPFAQNRDLVRFSVKTAAAGRQPGRPLNLVLLLDNSGSMERADRVRILREALRVLAAQLQPQDRLSVVTFARTPRLWHDGVTGDKAGAAVARVGEITPQGGTNLEAALDLGYATALKHYQPGSISRVVLLTDGAANLGDVNPDALKRKVETNRQHGVALDCFGIGWEGYDDTLLETLARNGDGRYGFINTPEEAASGFAAQLAGALRVAASDVKVQVEWNPRRVTAYRQIGYAKHQLKKEQFRDNTVDAAEIGAAESGNALYVVEVNPRGEGDLATVRVRFKVPGTADYKEHEWSVPFTKDAPSLEQASPALRLAGTASAFSEWLVASPYAAEVTTDRLLGLLNGVPAIYPADPRPKKLEWMIRTAKSVSGR